MEIKTENRGGKRAGAGRKSLIKGEKRITLGVSLSIEQSEKIRSLAAKEGVSISRFILQKCGLAD